jgi:DNA binding domain, excisionase family
MSRVVPLVPLPSPDELEQLLTPSEAAELLSVPVSWIYQHARPKSKDRLPYIKVGTYTRFRESELRAWLDRHRG